MGITEIIYGFGGLCLKIRDDFMNFKPCFKVYDLFSILAKWLIITWSFMSSWCQFIDWLKFETRPSFLRNFGMAYKRGAIIRRYNKRRYKGTGYTALVRVSTATFMWERNSFKGKTFFWFLFYTVKYFMAKHLRNKHPVRNKPINQAPCALNWIIMERVFYDDRLIFLFSHIPIESMTVADADSVDMQTVHVFFIG